MFIFDTKACENKAPEGRAPVWVAGTPGVPWAVGNVPHWPAGCQPSGAPNTPHLHAWGLKAGCCGVGGLTVLASRRGHQRALLRQGAQPGQPRTVPAPEPGPHPAGGVSPVACGAGAAKGPRKAWAPPGLPRPRPLSALPHQLPLSPPGQHLGQAAGPAPAGCGAAGRSEGEGR